MEKWEIELKEKLNQELKQLKDVTGKGSTLKVELIPRHKTLDAELPTVVKPSEVVGDTIIIYEIDESQALKTLKFGFFEHIFTEEIIEPYERLVNSLLEIVKGRVLEAKFKLIEKLVERV